MTYDPDYKDVGISYEYLQTILEKALEECGYYKTISDPLQPSWILDSFVDQILKLLDAMKSVCYTENYLPHWLYPSPSLNTGIISIGCILSSPHYPKAILSNGGLSSKWIWTQDKMNPSAYSLLSINWIMFIHPFQAKSRPKRKKVWMIHGTKSQSPT